MQKLHNFFFSKNTCELDIVLTGTVHIFTTNKLVKLKCFEQLGPGFLDHTVRNKTVLKWYHSQVYVNQPQKMHYQILIRRPL